MDKRPVLFIDSGIGGIPYCKNFMENNPRETVCYLADHKNFPYGPKDREELISILITLTENVLEKINPKLIVLACNTATIAALSALRRVFPQVQFVGTVPAVKPAAKACGNGKIGVLGTARTIQDVSAMGLADNNCEILGIAAPDLVDFIELRFDYSGENEKMDIVRKYVALFQAENVGTLVLGCTHFLFLLEEFRSEAKPYFEVFDSLAGITKRIEYLLDENDGALRAKEDSRPEYRLLLTGTETANSVWQERAQKYGFNLFFFDEL